MSAILYKNEKLAEITINYLYGQRLRKDEVYKVVNEAFNKVYVTGLNHGEVVTKNVTKRIKNAQLKCRKKRFELVLAQIEDEIAERKMRRK